MVASQILEVTQQAYAIEAALIGFDGIPYLHQKVRDVEQCDELFLGCLVQNQLARVISYKIVDGPILDIHRLVVSPNYFRQGIGMALVSFLLGLQLAPKIIVSTSIKNLPALRLYEKMGFQVISTELKANGEMEIVHLMKQ